jgi:hypothetical protein
MYCIYFFFYGLVLGVLLSVLGVITYLIMSDDEFKNSLWKKTHKQQHRH